jgi:hypothetical protein
VLAAGEDQLDGVAAGAAVDWPPSGPLQSTLVAHRDHVVARGVDFFDE